MKRVALFLRAHRRDLRWYWLGAQIPLLVLAMLFAPQIEAKVRGPENAALERTLKPVIDKTVTDAFAASRFLAGYIGRHTHG